MKYKFIQAKRKEDIERCLSLRHRVYIEQMNCFKNGNEQDIWDKHSTHFLALDEDNKPIGTIRFIPYNSNGLPLEQYVNLSQYVHTQGIVIYAEISRFITDYKSPPLDRNLIPFGLFKCCYDHAIETKTNDVFATSKINHLNIYKAIGFQQIDEPFYDTDLEERCVPIHLNINKTYKEYQSGSDNIKSSVINAILGESS